MRKATLNDVRKELRIRLARMFAQESLREWKAERSSGGIGWVDAEGNKYDLRMMNDEHLANLYACLLRKSGEGKHTTGERSSDGDDSEAAEAVVEHTPFDLALGFDESATIEW